MSKLLTLGMLMAVLWAPTLKGGQDPTAASANVEIDGKLKVSIEDYPDKKSRVRYSLETDTAHYPLDFGNSAPNLQQLKTGSTVRVKGKHAANGSLLISGEDTGIETLHVGGADAGTAPAYAPVVNTFGAQNTLWILVNFQDNPTLQPWTTEQVRAMTDKVSTFFLENSYQQTWLNSDVVGWFTIQYSSTTCDQPGIANHAKSAAAAAGSDLSKYARFVYVFPSSSCPFAGAATVEQNPSQAWINGDLSLEVVAHELGHNLGLYHSHSTVCRPECSTLEYGDTVDMMGASRYAHFNAFNKERLGWLNYGSSPPLTTVQANGTYTLDPYESVGTNAKALRILKGVDPWGSKVWYYVEYRQPIGFDSNLASSHFLEIDGNNILNGVLIHTGSPEESGNTNFLLDMTPETYHLYSQDPALPVGKTFSDPASGVTIAVLWANGTDAGVSVTLNQTPADSLPPTTSITTPVDGAVVSGVLTVQAVASDNTGIKQVDFLVDGVVKGTRTSAPYTFLWDTSASGKGTHTLRTIARDTAGNVGNSAPITNIVPDAPDTTPPTVTVTTPTNGAIVARNTPVTVTASAADDRGVTKVEFYVANKLIGADASAPYTATWKVTGKANASYVIKAVAYDQAGNTTSVTVSVTAR